MSKKLQQQLTELAYDFWWTGDPWANDTWKALNPQMWEASNHNPLLMLKELDVSKADKSTKDALEDLVERYENFKQKPRPQNLPTTVYFCMEFGIHESFPIYSGGLGILAGDHIRSAGDMGIPLNGIGILYKHGYFSQMIVGGRQVSANPDYTKHILPIKPLTNEDGNRIEFTIPMGREKVRVQVWTLKVGHATLYLLDTNLLGAPEHHKELTNNLYGMENGLRIKQEILLGIGGIRLLDTIDSHPEVYHLNEGHAAFLIYELWIKKIKDGVLAEQAWHEVCEKCVLTRQGRAYEETSTGINPPQVLNIKRSRSGSRSGSSSKMSLPSGTHLEGVTARNLLELPLRQTVNPAPQEPRHNGNKFRPKSSQNWNVFRS